MRKPVSHRHTVRHMPHSNQTSQILNSINSHNVNKTDLLREDPILVLSLELQRYSRVTVLPVLLRFNFNFLSVTAVNLNDDFACIQLAELTALFVQFFRNSYSLLMTGMPKFTFSIWMNPIFLSKLCR